MGFPRLWILLQSSRFASTMLNDANKLDDETEMTIKSEQASVKLRAGKVVLVMMNDFSDSALAE